MRNGANYRRSVSQPSNQGSQMEGIGTEEQEEEKPSLRRESKRVDDHNEATVKQRPAYRDSE